MSETMINNFLADLGTLWICFFAFVCGAFRKYHNHFVCSNICVFTFICFLHFGGVLWSVKRFSSSSFSNGNITFRLCQTKLYFLPDAFDVFLLTITLTLHSPITFQLLCTHIKHHTPSDPHTRSFWKFWNVAEIILVSARSVLSLHLSGIRCVLVCEISPLRMSSKPIFRLSSLDRPFHKVM